MEWIKVEDKLPETKKAGSSDFEYNTSDRVLIFGKNSGIEIGRYLFGNDDGFWSEWVDDNEDDPYPYDPFEITHWMPLPAKPITE